MKILAVDDDDSIRDLLTLQLRRHGYDVVTAADGEEALEKAPDADFIVLDLMLPKLDGYEVCRRLKSAEKTKNIPIIMLTAKTEEIDTVLGLELGADDYMAKPFSMRELLARIWGYEYYGDTRTVDVHIRHLRSKLASAPEIAKAIETVRGVGYRFQYEEAGK
ncbi:MAG: response regulator transcription factor [Selenomonas sp.]|nr:response regulator transcription factor [Selenomonas sp.]